MVYWFVFSLHIVLSIKIIFVLRQGIENFKINIETKYSLELMINLQYCLSNGFIDY
jgi:hypothetical protein